ncbi:unnamed protein product [Allacma fusca]|uniref:Uncharacterized protein n=1 Tax=Allacma fusca TaxID=39272 RepID=A0A8J2L923_9HEXA|nr:unnamed protein product [Allacma fusca]
MIGGIWLGSAVTTLLAVVYFQEADAIHCLVCSSDKALRSGLYHKNCKNPTKDWQTKDHPNLWDCSNYDATMNKHLKEWRDELGKKQNITERKHSESPGCTEYSICRSMYYEADMEYHLLTGGRMYRMVDDKEHVFRYCGCLYSSEVKKAQADLIKVEFSGKGTKCEDEIKGKTPPKINSEPIASKVGASQYNPERRESELFPEKHNMRTIFVAKLEDLHMTANN